MSIEDEEFPAHNPNELGEHILTPEAFDNIIKTDAKKPLTKEQLLRYSEDDVEAILSARNVRKGHT